MNWISNFVRPKIRSLVGVKSDVPENLWVQCPSCEQMLFHRDLEENLQKLWPSYAPWREKEARNVI